MDIHTEKCSIIKQISQIEDINSLKELRFLLSSFKITSEENETLEVPEWQKEIVRNRLKDDQDSYLNASEVLLKLRKKYSVDTL